VRVIGDKIREFRKKKKLTQVELGKKIGVEGATVTRYENGGITPTYEVIKKIADALTIPIGELLTEDQQDGRKLDAANRGLQSLLESLYDTVDFDWHCTVDRDGEPEYDGDFSVTLSRKGEQDVTLTKGEWEALFSMVCGAVPGFVKLIEEHQDYEPPYNTHDL
jgi:transcriptional regulator with XRE-family HTH domain